MTRIPTLEGLLGHIGKLVTAGSWIVSWTKSHLWTTYILIVSKEVLTGRRGTSVTTRRLIYERREGTDKKTELEDSRSSRRTKTELHTGGSQPSTETG